MAEVQKANIRSEADRKIAEIDHDMEELERLTAKYGLSVGEPSPASTEQTGTQPVRNGIVVRRPIPRQSLNPGGTLTTNSAILVADALKQVAEASVTKRARVAAAAYIREKKRPVPLAELDAVLTANGIKFDSETPRNTLSAVLGQDPTLCSLGRDRGWWLSELGDPPNGLEALRRL
jgi:hypothetical protein